MILLSQEARKTALPLDQSEWMKILKEVIQQGKNSEGNFFIFGYDKNGKPQVINLQDDMGDWEKRQTWSTPKEADLQRAVVFRLSSSGLAMTPIEFPKPNKKQYDPFVHIHYNDVLGAVVVDDGYQVQFRWSEDEADTYGKGWRKILPHERRGGEYELLTPEQRIKAIAKQYGTQYGFTNPDGSIKQEAVKILYDAQGKPAVLLLVEGKNGAPEQYGLSPALNNPQIFEKAWQRLNEVDPDIASLLTRVYGLKLIGGDLGTEELTFSHGREFYMSSLSPDKVEINELNMKNPSLTYAMFVILDETRAIAHDYGLLSTDSTLPYWARSLDPNSGVDKGNFVLRWIEENKSRLTSQEIKDLTEDSNFVIKWYEQNAKK